MRVHTVFLALLGWAMAGSLAAKNPDGASAEQIAANDNARALGERIYWHDQAALNGSARLMSQVNLANHPEVRGYVTKELEGAAIALVYYAVIEGEYFAFAEYILERSTIVSGGPNQAVTDSPLPADLVRLAKARDAALTQGAKEQLQLCMTNSANFVTLPANKDDLVSVYLLSSAITPGRYPIGGHYMFQVNAQNAVVGGRAFSDRCLDVPVINTFVVDGPDNFTMSHSMDSHPNAVHHFVARQMNLPLVLGIDEMLWTLDYREAAGAAAKAD